MKELNLLRTLIDNLPDYIFVKDVQSRFVISNIAHMRVMGAKTPEEIVGKNDFDIFPQKLAAQYYADEQEVMQTGQPLINREEIVIDPEGRKQWLLTTKVPLRDDHGKIIGLVGISRDITKRKQTADEKVRLFEEVCQRREQLRSLARRLAEAQEAERRQLAQELHDRVGRNLTALGFNLDAVRTLLPGTSPESGPIQACLDKAQVLLKRTAECIHDVMANLRPPVLDGYGLIATLHWYKTQFDSRRGFTIIVQGEEPTPRLAAPVELALFRITQEALTNVVKHAQASQAIVTVTIEDEIVSLIVRDDGLGFEPGNRLNPIGGQGWGLITMIERAEAVEGRCRIESSPGQGTQVIVEVPR